MYPSSATVSQNWHTVWLSLFATVPINRESFEDTIYLVFVNAQSSSYCQAYRGLVASLLNEQNEHINGSKEVYRFSWVTSLWKDRAPPSFIFQRGQGTVCLVTFGEIFMSASFRYFRGRTFRRSHPIGSQKAAGGDKPARERRSFQAILWDHSCSW